jgi:hypothetical protein
MPEWDITEENRDPSKCPQKWGDEWDVLQQLYPELHKQVGTSDFVWCYAKYAHWRRPEIHRLWEFDVPSSKIFQFLDSGIWAKMYQDVENNKQSEDICWKKLIMEKSEGIEKISTGNHDNLTLLMCVPLCDSIQVIYKNKFNKGPKFADASAQYDDLPTSEWEARKCRDRGPKPGDWKRRD